MAYNTNYRGINTASGKVLFCNTNSACFAQFTTNYPSLESIFSSGRTMEVFAQVSTIQVSVDVVDRWINDLNTLGFPIDLEIIKIKDIENYPKRLKKNLDHYRFSLDFSKYSSKAHVKLALYLIRYIYEERLYTVIEKLYELKDKSPDDCIWELFQFACTIGGHDAVSGHYVFSSYMISEPISLTTLKDRHIQIWANTSYRDTELMTLVKDLTGPNGLGKTYSPIMYPHIRTMNLTEYKEFIKEIKDGKTR